MDAFRLKLQRSGWLMKLQPKLSQKGKESLDRTEDGYSCGLLLSLLTIENTNITKSP